jgi:hypothetical protein
MDGIKKRDDSSTATFVFGCRRANIRDKIEGEVMAADEVAALSFRIDETTLHGRADASDEDDSDDDEKATVVLETIAMMMTMTMAADLVLGRRLIAFAVFMVEWGDRMYLHSMYINIRHNIILIHVAAEDGPWRYDGRLLCRLRWRGRRGH